MPWIPLMKVVKSIWKIPVQDSLKVCSGRFFEFLLPFCRICYKKNNDIPQLYHSIMNDGWGIFLYPGKGGNEDAV